MNFHNGLMNLKRNKNEIFIYILCALLCITLLVWILQLWNADFTIPFSYNGDGLQSGMLIKGLIDNPWWFSNDFLGAPFGQENFDFPVMDTLNSSVLKLLGGLFQNYAIAMNLFYILTFPFVALTSLYVFRELGISPGPSVVGSILFTFIPSHFFRGVPHFPYSAYFLIPLAVLVMIWIYEKKPVLFNFEKNTIDFWNFYSCMSLIICGLLALQNIYHLYFTCFFFLIIGIILSIKNRNKTYLISTLLLIGFMGAIFFVSVSPSLLYQQQNGPNPAALLRSPSESEFYGLKIIQLILPIPKHRLPLFAAINKYYSTTAPLINENEVAALGLIGTFGFLLLILWIFIRVEGTSFPILSKVKRKINCLSVLNMSAILLSTIGGFGTFIAYHFFDGIRAYNRISIFIAFFAIAMIILLLNIVQNEYCTTTKRKVLFLMVLCILLIGGVLDQSQSLEFNYHSTKQQFSAHQQYIESIEEKMPENSMIYQYPYVQYLGWGDTPAEFSHYGHSYEAVIPYLHSKSLRWSYGSMVNRKGDVWNRKISELSLKEQIDLISFAGFGGILVDQKGYENSDKSITKNLQELLQTEPLVSADNRYYFYDMADYNSKLRSSVSAEKWDSMVIETLNPILIEWTGGFSVFEGSRDSNLRWCGTTGELHITNPSNQYRTVSFETIFGTGYVDDSHLTIHTTGYTDTFKINSTGAFYNKTISLPPGETIISFSSDAKRVVAPGESRYLIFYLKNFKFNNYNFVLSRTANPL